MKTQICSISPHQNGKVFGVLTAITSLIFVVPMGLVALLVPSPPGQSPFPQALLFLLFPVIYLVMGYVMTAISCIIYNRAFKYIGGFEYEATESQSKEIKMLPAAE